MGFFKNKFDKATRPAIKRYAMAFGTSQDKVQISMYLKQVDPENWISAYNILESYKPRLKDVEFEKIVNYKIDIFNVSQMVPAFITKTLNAFSESEDIAKDKISAMVFLNDDEVLIWLYDGTQPLKELKEADIFSAESMVDAE